MNNTSRICLSEERRRMIETAAYFRAEKKGFSGNDPLKDWLEAEKEIEAACRQPDDGGAGMQEHAAYQRMRAEFKKILAGAQDTISADTINQAFNRSVGELKALGKFVPAAIDHAAKRLAQEVAGAVHKMGPRWDSLSERSQGLFDIWKDKGSQFVNQAHTALNSWVSRRRDNNGR